MCDKTITNQNKERTSFKGCRQWLLWKQLLGGLDQVLIARAVFICTELGGFMKGKPLVEHTLTTEGREEEEEKHQYILITLTRSL